MYKILVVDDEKDMVAVIAMNLEREGFEVLQAFNGESALQIAEREHPHLVILDVMMPGMNGLQVCRALREREVNTRIIMLSAKSDEIDRVVGLEIGADDYLTKPFSMHELVAIINARLRYRAESAREFVPRYAFSEVEIDFEKLRAIRAGKHLSLTPREFDVLQLLIRHRGQVLTRDRILDKLWGHDSYTSPRTVDNFILKLRKKIEADPADPRHIISVYGGGYKFVG